MTTYMEKGNTVKVTRKDHEDFNKIGIIIDNNPDGTRSGFVIVKFDSYTKKHAIANLFDMSI